LCLGGGWRGRNAGLVCTARGSNLEILHCHAMAIRDPSWR
jgi:hypothetical protein